MTDQRTDLAVPQLDYSIVVHLDTREIAEKEAMRDLNERLSRLRRE